MKCIITYRMGRGLKSMFNYANTTNITTALNHFSDAFDGDYSHIKLLGVLTGMMLMLGVSMILVVSLITIVYIVGWYIVLAIPLTLAYLLGETE